MPPRIPAKLDYFEIQRQSWRRLQREETRPGGNPRLVDLAVMPTCMMCDNPMEKPLVCAGCKSAVYCGKSCIAANWKRGKTPRALPHKAYCAANAVQMKRTPIVREMLQQFPWGRVEMDATFAADVARARFDVLGGLGYGFWSEAGGITPHLSSQGQDPINKSKNKEMRALAEAYAAPAEYIAGYHLLTKKLPNDEEGWKLSPELIPWLNFDATHKPPPPASEAKIVNWHSWYQWRGLPKQSPAALLMNFPLSVYQMLVSVSEVTSPTISTAQDRHEVVVHYLGAEVELNFIPIFAELALLLPYTDIILVMYGPAVHDVVQKAKKTRPQSLAALASPSAPVYTYTAPEESGSGTIKICIDGRNSEWPVAQPELTDFSPGRMPSALVACNAGILSYPAWSRVIAWCTITGVPFAVTEYAEQSAESQRDAFPIIVQHSIEALGGIEKLDERERASVSRVREYSIKLNPFARPGQRAVPCSRLPNLVNGFTIEVA
ncbi:hypothetical protein FRB95_012019 [Tulasnella sp. JGI-2019a]|nr:hypothetical protein FRB93_007401 [Tulasnella sp. JGI-2019a]KAG9024165.1 hypothetical protein FRB95_012019 [Tulasnella sp. JGI-2019a]